MTSIAYASLVFPNSGILHSSAEFDETEFDFRNIKNIYLGKKVLIVEDIPSNFQLLHAFLAPTGLTVIHEVDGEHAYAAFKRSPDFDLILMDIRLPDVSGLMITKMIRELSPDIPIIAQTAYALDADRYQCLEAGC
ncbi:MAG TPA: response regulator, partial [Bacteroidales bacterium]|nr:response regulator [Bacteroidales bacterium]